MIGGGFLLTCQDAVTKWLTAEYSTGEIMFWRGLFSFLPLIVLIWYAGGLGVLRPKNVKGVTVRSVLALATSFSIVLSFAYLPLADALAIVFISPVLMTALSVPFLGEHVGMRRWLAVAMGFVGVVIMLRPGGAIQWAVLIPLAAASFSAIRDIVTRRVGAGDSAVTILFYSVLLATPAGLLDMPQGFRVPAAGDFIYFIGGGIFWGMAHFLQIQAFAFAKVSTVAPFKYLSLVWGVILGFLIWRDVPDQWLLVGSLLVVGSGLYVLHRENVARAAALAVNRPAG